MVKEKSPLRQQDIRTGARQERERIREAILNAPIAFDFFGPYIARDKLMEILEGESNERTN